MSNDKAYRSGEFVFDQLGNADTDNIEPNGVDIRADKIYRQTSTGIIGVNDKTVGDMEEVEPEELEEGEEFSKDNNPVYMLGQGQYLVEYKETVHIPKGHIGYVYPRSTVMRNFSYLFSALWDSGYRGKGYGLLMVFGNAMCVQKGAPIGQMTMARAHHESDYDGAYQYENLTSYEEKEDGE